MGWGGVGSRCCWCGVIGDGVEVDHGVSGDHVMLLRGDVFRGSSFDVLGFLVPFEIVCRVVRRRWLEGGWEWFGSTRLGGA